uniref:Uncharacterized protein n=1 Tax=Fagus sylvatica TaxID=28930 RepID=A0A2N9FD86_FAGSY
MAPKKSFGEGSKKRHKSRAQEDEPATMDNTFCSSEHSVKLDLAFYIAWHMDSCVKKKNAALPCGLHITSILEHFEINLSGERETRKVKRDAIVEEELDEEAQMEEDGAREDEEAMHEESEPPTAPLMAPSSSYANEDTSN